MTRKRSPTVAKVLEAAAKLTDADKRAAYLERALVRVDKPAPLVEPLFDAWYDGSPSADEIGAKALALARKHEDNSPVLTEIGCELDVRYREDEALEVVQLAIAAGAKNKRVLETLGRLLVRRGDATGVPFLERAVAAFPTWAKPRIALAAWFVERDPAHALVVLGEVDTGRSHDLRAMIHTAAGRTSDATVALRIALASYDNFVDARRRLSEWHFVENRFARALFHAKSLLEMRQHMASQGLEEDHDVDAIDEAILQAYRLGGGFAELVPWLRERCKTEVPDSLAWDLWYGITSDHPCPDRELAIRAAEVCRQRDLKAKRPDEAQCWRVRIAGLRALELGDEDALVALARDGLADSVAAWAELADQYRCIGLYDAAHAAVDRALQLDPDSAEAIDTLFGIALSLGDEAVMHRTATAVAAAKPLWHQGSEHLGRSFARRCEPAPALLHARKAVELAPHCHNAWCGLGEAHLVAGDHAAAREALARSLALEAAQFGDDISVLRAAVEGNAEVLERELAERYKQLPALPFPAFVEKLRAAARSMP